MSILTKINDIERERIEEEKLQTERAKKSRKIRKANLDEIFKRFTNGIMELNGEKVSGHKITIKPYKSNSAPRQKMLEMFVDGNAHLIFQAEEKATYCNCSQCSAGGNCGNPGPDYFYFIRISPAVSTNDEYLSFDSLCDYELVDEDRFANSILRLVDDYENRSDVNE